ncbi:MAG: FCD domain-containing protein [Chloroflexota bacterium]
MTVMDLESDILQYIVDNDLHVGDRLPPLTELSDILDISVSKLREQLEVARCLELVGVKPGAGTQIHDFNFASIIRIGLTYSLALSDQNFEAYKALRIATTAAFWEEAVSLLTPKNIEEVRALIEAAWSQLNHARIRIPHQEHRAFHLALFEQLDNPFVRGIEEGYWLAYEAIELNSYLDYQYLTEVWKQHEKMIDLIEAGKFSESKAVFIEHTQLLRFNHQS